MRRPPSLSRRNFLRSTSFALALPMFHSLLTASEALALTTTARRRFIGVYSPNGTYMPTKSNGFWTWEQALQPLVTAGHKNNVAIPRGLKSGFPNLDIHWSGCGGFLSCKPFPPNPAQIQCGKTVDQFVADRWPTPLRPLNVGWAYRDFSEHAESHSPIYLNSISWKSDTQPVSTIYSTTELFAKVFSGGSSSANQLFLHRQRQKKSVLDKTMDQIRSLNKKLSSDDQSLLDSYLTGVREIELQLKTNIPQCQAGELTAPAQKQAHEDHFKLMQKIIVKAFQCNLTSAATIQYDAGVGAFDLLYPGVSLYAHSYHHHNNLPDNMRNLLQINQQQMRLFAHLITELKNAQLLQETLVVYGSDMADGNVHSDTNLPFLVAGAGSDLRFGQELGSPSSTTRPVSDLYMDVFKLLDVEMSAFGSGQNLNTGKSTELIIT